MTEAEIEAVGTAVPDGARQMQWLLRSVGVSTLDAVGWIRVTGEDRVRWLNGMVTNSIVEVEAGGGSTGLGNYSFVLNAQGRIQGDLVAFAGEAGELLLQTSRDRVSGMMEMFDRFIIMDDVALEDVSPERFGVGLIGSKAAELLAWLELPAPDAMSRVAAAWRGTRVEVIGAYSPLVRRFEVWSDRETSLRLQVELTAGAEALGGGGAGTKAVEWLRMLEGTPRFGVDIRERELPQETGQRRALHFSKGCYLGQEIVERIRSRGNVHRTFGGFLLDGPLPAVGAALEADGKSVGELTSVAAVPLPGGMRQVALGYVRREAVERKMPLRYATDQGAGSAEWVALPIRLD